jgi:hypothetical protein
VFTPDRVSDPVPERVIATVPLEDAPSVIASVKAAGLAVPLIVSVLMPPPLLRMLPPPTPFVREAISWLKPFRSKMPPLLLLKPIVTFVVVGRAFAVPLLITPLLAALKIVLPV